MPRRTFAPVPTPPLARGRAFATAPPPPARLAANPPEPWRAPLDARPGARPVLVVDAETTGFFDDGETFQPPRLVQIAWGLYAPDGFELAMGAQIVRPDGFTIPRVVVEKAHGITTERARAYGRPLAGVMGAFAAALYGTAGEDYPGPEAPCAAQAIVAHNLEDFDRYILGPELGLCGYEFPDDAAFHDTRLMARALLPNHRGRYSLPVLYEALFDAPMRPDGGRHDAVDDVRACARLYFALRARLRAG